MIIMLSHKYIKKAVNNLVAMVDNFQVNPFLEVMLGCIFVTHSILDGKINGSKIVLWVTTGFIQSSKYGTKERVLGITSD